MENVFPFPKIKNQILYVKGSVANVFTHLRQTLFIVFVKSVRTDNYNCSNTHFKYFFNIFLSKGLKSVNNTVSASFLCHMGEILLLDSNLGKGIVKT